jgi:tetratricopeptide (TPR) repeat protein
VLVSFEKTLTENKDKLKNHERSELTLFEARLYEGLGNYEKALEILSKENQIFDETAKFERLAENYIKLGNKEKAIENLEYEHFDQK